MAGDEILEFAKKAVVTFVLLFVVVKSLSLIFSSTSTERGDPFYAAQQNLTNVLEIVIPWLSPGILGVTAIILGMLYYISRPGEF
jgi:hypothetical protein